jgi:hypothetical protein
MLKRIVFLSALITTLSLAARARADEDTAGPTQDLTPVSLQIQRVSGEFGGESLRISVGVQNVGSLPVHGSRGGLQVGSIVNPQAALYGPNGVGGLNLGAPIPPGATGLFLIDAPAGSLRHCQSVTVRIDTAQSLQSGTTLVFYNDAKALTAIDRTAVQVCRGGVRW